MVNPAERNTDQFVVAVSNSWGTGLCDGGVSIHCVFLVYTCVLNALFSLLKHALMSAAF